jgi:hypothetical protein
MRPEGLREFKNHLIGYRTLKSYILDLMLDIAKRAVYKSEITAVGIRHADHVVPSIRKSWH